MTEVFPNTTVLATVADALYPKAVEFVAVADEVLPIQTAFIPETVAPCPSAIDAEVLEALEAPCPIATDPVAPELPTDV